MAGRSQRHMREFQGHFTADASGQAKPTLLATIADPASTTTVSENFSASFSGYPLTFSATNLPESTTIAAATGIVTGTSSAGTYSDVTITATNAFGYATATFNWTVS